MRSETVRRFCILITETFSNSITFAVTNKYGKGAVAQISTVFVSVYNVAFQIVFRNGTFIYLTRFSESVTSKIHQPWGSSFFENIRNFIYILKNAKKDWENFFLFRDDCISIGCINFSLLILEGLWTTVSLLKNSRKILPITKRDFSELSCLHRDQ